MPASIDPSAALTLPRRPLRILLLAVALLAVTIGGLWLRARRQPTHPLERLIQTEAPAAPAAPWEGDRVCNPGQDHHDDRWASQIIDVVLPPGASGPYIREWRQRGRRRDGSLLSRRLSEIADDLTPCYRFARQREPALEGTLSGHLRLDEWGHVTAAVLVGAPRAAEAARCLQGALIGQELGDYAFSTLRLSEVPLTVHLRRSGLRRPQGVKRPPPGAIAAAPPGVCLLRPRQLEQDTLPPQELWVDDYDEAQAEEEAREDWRVERARWEARGKKGPRPEEARPLERPRRRGQPQEVSGGVSFNWPLFLRHLSRRLGYNVGAYRDCYLAAARAGSPPSLRVLSVSFDSTGYVHDARDQREPPDALSRCLEASVREVWVSGPLHPVSVTLRLGPSDPAMALLAPPPGLAPPRASVAEVERLAEAALAAGDGPRAAARFASLLREVPVHPQRCQWHVGRLSAAELRAPWGGEPLQEALEALGRELSVPGAPGRAACLGRAAPLIARLLGEDRDGALHERALALLPDLPNRRALRHRLAELWAAGRNDGHVPAEIERWEGSACRAGALYLQLAEEECRDPAVRCWPGEAAVKELRICSEQEGPRLRCAGCFPAPTPVPPSTRLLHRAGLFLLTHAATPPDWHHARTRYWVAQELGRGFGQLAEAAALLRELLSRPLPGEPVDWAQELLRDIEAHRARGARPEAP